MADPIKTDKVKVTTLKSTDPHILVTINTEGANIDSGDSLSASLVIMGENKVVIPSTSTTLVPPPTTTSFIQSYLHTFSIEIPSFVNQSSGGPLPGYLFVSLVDSDTSAGTVLILKVYKIEVTPVATGSPNEYNGTFTELFTHDPGTGVSMMVTTVPT